MRTRTRCLQLQISSQMRVTLFGVPLESEWESDSESESESESAFELARLVRGSIHMPHVVAQFPVRFAFDLCFENLFRVGSTAGMAWLPLPLPSTQLGAFRNGVLICVIA